MTRHTSLARIEREANLKAIAEAAKFVATAFADEAYDRSTLGSEQPHLLAISRAFMLFSDTIDAAAGQVSEGES